MGLVGLSQVAAVEARGRAAQTKVEAPLAPPQVDQLREGAPTSNPSAPMSPRLLQLPNAIQWTH